MAAATDTCDGEAPLSSAMWFGDPCEKVTCPYDANHQMPKSSLEKHMVSCKLRKLEYSKEEEWMQSSALNTASIGMDKGQQVETKSGQNGDPVVGGSSPFGSFSALPIVPFYRQEIPNNMDSYFENLKNCLLQRSPHGAPFETNMEALAEMYDSTFFYEKARIPKVQMDKNLQFDIIKQAVAKECGSFSAGAYSSQSVEVPHNHKRYICDLTQADRLAIYDYVLAETKNQRSRSQLTENDSDLFVDLAAKINQEDGQKGPKSHLEILAEMRDYKRRRQSYRAKNVHITKKSYTEVIRDVIGVHMEELTSHWQEENRNTDVCDEEASSFSAKSSGRKEERRSASADSRQSCGSSRDADHSRHRRNSSRSPVRRKRSRERERDSRRKRERDEDRHHSHKRRK